MRLRNIVTIIATGIIIATNSMGAGAAGDQPWKKFEQGIATAEREQRCSFSTGEVAVLGGNGGATAAQIAVTKGISGKVVAGGDHFSIIEASNISNIDFSDPSIAPVFRSGSATSAPFLFPNGEVIVKFKLHISEKQAASWGDAYGLTLVRPILVSSSFLFKAANPSKSLEAATSGGMSNIVVFCVPNWVRQRKLRQTDPLYAYQWHLKNTGYVNGTVAGNDINVETAWDTYKGSASQIVCIVDDGLEIAHKDLAANIVAGLSWNFVDNNADPTAGDHGTACGGVAAARGYNDIGVRGVAPETGLCGYRILGDEATSDTTEAEAEVRAYDKVCIYSNSWGPSDDGQRLEGPGPLTKAAMTDGVTTGRGGKGVIYVWAGGNGLDYGDNSNYDGYANWRYTIAVGASTSAGKQSWYSESGANLCINAPSNGGADTGITTVDRTGAIGYNTTGAAAGNFADLDVTTDFGGTSSACPTVSGSCALILQANQNLGWRDIKKILMSTAFKNDPSDADWTTNAAGYHINHKYGFGRLDVTAATGVATTWTNLGPEINAEGTVSPGLAIPLGSQGVSSTITLTSGVLIESVEVYFTADHSNWGDLSVVLTAPSGTMSVLAEKHQIVSSSSRYDNWRFGSVRNLGEMSPGNWTLTVRDLGTTGGGTFNNWKLIAYGTDPGANAVSLTTVASPPEGGSVSPAGISKLYKGVAAGISATAASGYYFTEWSATPEANVTFGFAGRKSPNTTITLTGDATLTATFSSTPPEMAAVSFVVFPMAGGFSDPSEQTSVNIGAGISIMTIPSTGYNFGGWTATPAENAEFASAGSMSTIAIIKGEVKITAVYKTPDIKLTQGSAIEVPAEDLGITVFNRKPKVTGTIGSKSYAMTVIGKFPLELLTAVWPAKPKIYNPADYKNPTDGLGYLLETEPMAPAPLLSLLVDATRADGVKLDLTSVSACMVSAPNIEFVIGELKEGVKLGVSGNYFGTKPPKVSIEYIAKNGRYARKSCKLVKEFSYTDAYGKPSCMDPLTGRSLMSVVYPKLPAGANPTGYMILTNPIGMCSYYLLPRG